MTESAIRSERRPAFYTATVIAPHHREISLAEFFLAIKRINPGIQVGTWAEADLAEPPTRDPGIPLLTLDGERLTIFTIDAPAPPEIFEIGMLPNFLMRAPAEVCRGHRCHVNVLPTRKPESRLEVLEIARAVTLARRQRKRMRVEVDKGHQNLRSVCLRTPLQ